jgi:hypothetical protein
MGRKSRKNGMVEYWNNGKTSKGKNGERKVLVGQASPPANAGQLTS